MHINRDQKVAIDFVRGLEYEPVQALVLTSKNTDLKLGVVSVLAVKDGRRYNLRVGIEPRKLDASLISVDELITLIDHKYSSDLTTINGCIIKDVVRNPVKVRS